VYPGIPELYICVELGPLSAVLSRACAPPSCGSSQLLVTWTKVLSSLEDTAT